MINLKIIFKKVFLYLGLIIAGLFLVTQFAINVKPLGSTTSHNLKQAISRESASALVGAFSLLKKKNKITAKHGAKDLLPYINYISIDTSTRFQKSALQCSAALPCVKLHNTGILQYDQGQVFDSTEIHHAIFFNFYPSPSGEDGYISFYIYPNGRLTTGGMKLAHTVVMKTNLVPQQKDPDWFKR